MSLHTQATKGITDSHREIRSNLQRNCYARFPFSTNLSTRINHPFPRVPTGGFELRRPEAPTVCGGVEGEAPSFRTWPATTNEPGRATRQPLGGGKTKRNWKQDTSTNKPKRNAFKARVGALWVDIPTEKATLKTSLPRKSLEIPARCVKSGSTSARYGKSARQIIQACSLAWKVINSCVNCELQEENPPASIHSWPPCMWDWEHPMKGPGDKHKWAPATGIEADWATNNPLLMWRMLIYRQYPKRTSNARRATKQCGSCPFSFKPFHNRILYHFSSIWLPRP